jgi:hypothetical protein
MLKISQEYKGRLVSHKGDDFLLSDEVDQVILESLYKEGLAKLFTPESVKQFEDANKGKDSGKLAFEEKAESTAGDSNQGTGQKPAK